MISIQSGFFNQELKSLVKPSFLKINKGKKLIKLADGNMICEDHAKLTPWQREELIEKDTNQVNKGKKLIKHNKFIFKKSIFFLFLKQKKKPKIKLYKTKKVP